MNQSRRYVSHSCDGSGDKSRRVFALSDMRLCHPAMSCVSESANKQQTVLTLKSTGISLQSDLGAASNRSFPSGVSSGLCTQYIYTEVI